MNQKKGEAPTVTWKTEGSGKRKVRPGEFITRGLPGRQGHCKYCGGSNHNPQRGPGKKKKGVERHETTNPEPVETFYYGIHRNREFPQGKV